MCEITNLNFTEKYPQILEDAQKSSFIALDCEFTGLGVHKDAISMFDDPECRYENMRSTISDLLVTQLGLSMFEYVKGQMYQTATYVFYLFPRSFPFSPESFTCDSRSMQFLALQNYDFNKTFRHGLTYITMAQLNQVAKQINSGKLIQKLKNELTIEDKRTMEDLCKTVYDWLYSNRATGSMTLDLARFDPIQRYIIRHHIESQFKVRTLYAEDFKLNVEKGERSDMEKKEELLRVIMGLSILIKDIVSLKKPVIGHNMFLDLMMFYKSFWGPLPENYSQFKTEIMKVFPVVYDTKLLAFEMRKRVGKSMLDTTFSLKHLFEFFTVRNGKNVVPEMPIVVIKPDSEHVSGSAHDSGYDSYCTGYVYLQLAHMFSMWDEKMKYVTFFPIGNNPPCYFRVTDPFKNRVNMMRGKVAYFNLDGPDPSNERPNLLLVETKSGRDLDPCELTKIIAKFDTADLRLLNNNQVLIATACLNKLRLIEVAITNAGDYKVSRYHPKPKVKMQTIAYLAMAALSMTGTVCLFLFSKYK